MSPLALLIDFGSTFTKVTAVDLDRGRVIGRAQAPSTVATDVTDGLMQALGRLEAVRAIAGKAPFTLDMLAGLYIRASSSAAGGLRIAVVGNVPGLTLEAGNAAALGAGGKVVATFAFKLTPGDVASLLALAPDLVLLTGGTDGGDRGTILHNAQALARSALTIPFVIAGNREAAAAACATLTDAGKQTCRAANVMPEASRLEPSEAQEAIRRQFMARITTAKGLERLGSLVPVVLPTPMAVLRAASLAAAGSGERLGFGELLLVDIGGATTDVHSIGHGRQNAADILPKGLPEPYEKRTVEGDLGIRVNASTVLDRIGAAGYRDLFRSLFPKLHASCAGLEGWIAQVSADTSRTPRTDWEVAADAALARAAADIAIARHVGRIEPYHSREGLVWLQTGKDLTEVRTVIGTGGVFMHNRYADRILAAAAPTGRPTVLRPLEPQVLLDRNYVLYAAGLLAEDHPVAAFRMLEHNLMHINGVARARGRDGGHAHGHVHGHAGDDCCD